MTDTKITDTVKKMTDDAQTQAKTAFAEANTRAKGAMEKGAKAFGDMNEFNKGNVEALVEASKVAAKGMQAMGENAAAYAKKSFETTTATVKSMAAVKSPTELFKIQGDYVRTAFDMMMSETARSTEAAIKLAGEVVQPIQNRFAIAADKMKAAA